MFTKCSQLRWHTPKAPYLDSKRTIPSLDYFFVQGEKWPLEAMYGGLNGIQAIQQYQEAGNLL